MSEWNIPREYLDQSREIERLKARVAELESALRWEAAVAGDECAYPTGEFCFDDKPESPDLWCTYCRITSALKGAG